MVNGSPDRKFLEIENLHGPDIFVYVVKRDQIPWPRPGNPSRVGSPMRLSQVAAFIGPPDLPRNDQVGLPFSRIAHATASPKAGRSSHQNVVVAQDGA
jgi:hypothetical protein